MRKEDVVRRLYSAYNFLLQEDRALLEVDANERSITHKLAEYLQGEFRGWNVDCEYNRSLELPKRLVSAVKTVSSDNTDGATVFPDVIVHHRGTPDNLLVIEAKKNTTGDEYSDLDKLIAYKTDHGYKFAFSLILPVLAAASTASAPTDFKEVS